MNPCKMCTAKCCRYFAMQIDTPRSKHDFENIKWYLAHKKVEVYVENKKWFLDIKNECRHLKEDHMCGIYDSRPLICREHDVTDCEHMGDGFAHDLVFKDMDDLDEYVRSRFSGKGKNKQRL